MIYLVETGSGGDGDERQTHAVLVGPNFISDGTKAAIRSEALRIRRSQIEKAGHMWADVLVARFGFEYAEYDYLNIDEEAFS